MNLRIPLAVVALALALPALAQYSSSTSSTVTSSGTTTRQSITTTGNGAATSITGGTGTGTYSASGVVVDPQADRALLGQVVAALSGDPAIQGATIDVQVVGGRVTLNGIALGPAQAEAARSIAQGVAGAANVTSNLSTSRQ